LESKAPSGCLASHFNSIGKNILGRHEALSKTIAVMAEKITELGTITYDYSSSLRYTLFNIRPKFTYIEPKPYSYIMLSNTTVVVKGGNVNVNIIFDWSKTPDVTKSGSGYCHGPSWPIHYNYKVSLHEEYFSFELKDIFDIQYRTFL
jgi:hypothetical protein